MLEIISKILTTDVGTKAKPVVLKQLDNGCIICTSHKLDSGGYLHLCRRGKWVRAHRLVYESFYGPIPDGLLVCHDCDNRACLNPEDFFIGTYADNNRDKAEKGRAYRAFGNTWNKGHTWTRGEKSGNAKLTDEKVEGIRQKYQTGNYTLERLGKEYGVSFQQIWRIVNNENWRHLEPHDTNPLDIPESLT